MKQLFFFIFLSLSAMYSICQSTKRVDSLTQITKYSKNDTIVVNSYLKLYEEFEYIDIDSAIFYCINALDLSRSIKNKKLEGYSLYYLGGLYDTKGDYENAYNLYLEALNLFEKINNKQGLGGCYNCIGILHWEQCEQASKEVQNKKLSKALEYIKKGLKYYTDIDYKMGMGVCYMNNGIVYNDYGKLAENNELRNERYNKAIENYKKAIANFEIISDGRSIADCNLNIALLYYDIYLNKNDSILTTKYYNRINKYLISANNQYKSSNDVYGKAMTLKNLATVNIDYSRSQVNKKPFLLVSINYAKESLEYANELNALFLKYDAYYSLYKAFKYLNNTENALKYHELYLAVRDSVLDAKKEETIQEIETKYETEKKNGQIKELTIKNIKSESTKAIYLIVAGFLFLVSVIMVFFFRQKQKINTLLNSKNEELERLNNTQSKLMSIISHDFKAPMSAFFSITSTLISKIDALKKADIEKYLKRMQNSSLGLKIQLENMLNWSISQSSEIRVNKAKFILSNTISRLILVLEEFANEKGISIQFSDNDEISINSDERLISIILNNLITNAIKYSGDNSTVKIEVKRKENRIILIVEDHGIGIKEVDLINMLSDDNSHHKINDTGLGMVVTKEIIKKLNGKLLAESKLNVGTTFYVELYE